MNSMRSLMPQNVHMLQDLMCTYKNPRPMTKKELREKAVASKKGFHITE